MFLPTMYTTCELALPLETRFGYNAELCIAVYIVSSEERSIFWELIVLVILSKKV